MPRIPTPLTWKRRKFAVFEPMGMIDRLYAVAVSGIVAGPFAIYNTHTHEHHLIHLPSQAKIISLEMQSAAKPMQVVMPEIISARNVSRMHCSAAARRSPSSANSRSKRATT